MKNIEEYVSMLVHMSKVDNHVADEESKLIHYIGEANGLSREKVNELIDDPHDIPAFDNIERPDRYQYLFDIIQLMKVDGKVYNSEINFAEKMALKLGFKAGVVAELSAYIYSDPEITTNKGFLISLASEYLID